MGKRELALLPTVSLFVTDLGCHLVQVSFPLEELSKAQVVIFSLLPEHHPLPGARVILETMSYCLYELCAEFCLLQKGSDV